RRVGARAGAADAARHGWREAGGAGGDDDRRREGGRGVRGDDRDAVSARQSPRVGRGGGGREGNGAVLRGVPSVRDDGVPLGDGRGGGEPQAVQVYGERAGR